VNKEKAKRAYLLNLPSLTSIQLFAASPELHDLLHTDSHQADHQCAIKLLSDGQVNLEPAQVHLYIPEHVSLSRRSFRPFGYRLLISSKLHA
jgi:hypothetical protein